MNIDEKSTTDNGTILLVDDTPANLDFIIVLLQKKNYVTAVSTSGNAAIIDAEKLQPDIILLDIMMPGIDGFETCRKLKENPKTRHIPVIFMSALSDAIVKVKGFDAGGVDYITKPVEIKELLVRIKAHQSVSKMQQKLINANILLASAQEKLALLQRDYDKIIDEQNEFTKDFNKAFLMNSFGFWRWNLASGKVTFSDSMYKIFEQEKDCFENDNYKIIPSKIHPDDVNKLVELNKIILKGDKARLISYRITNSAGKEKIILRRCEFEYDEEKQSKAVFGIDQDISEIVKLTID